MAIPPFGAAPGAKFPSQSGHTGEFLQTTGTTVQWQVAELPKITGGLSFTVDPNYSAYISDEFEISLNDEVEIGLGATLELG